MMVRFVYSDMNSTVVAKDEYPSCVQTSMLTFYWKFHSQEAGTIKADDLIEMAIVSKTRGWVSIGLDYNKTGMNQADCFIGYFDQEKNVPVLNDDWMPGKSIPKSDLFFGGSNDILNVTGSFHDGLTTLKFIRKVDTGDSLADKPIRNATVGISWAICANSNDLTKVHTSYGQFKVNMMTHVGVLNMVTPKLIQFHLIATGAVAILLTLIGMSYTYISIKERNYCISLIFHTKIVGLIRNEFLGSWLNPFLELTLGEMILIIVHLMLTSIWFCFGFFNNSSPIISKIGKGFGYASVITLTTTILPITRYSALVHIFGVSFERAIKYHKWSALLTLLVTTLHGIFMGIPMGMNGNLEKLISVKANGFVLFGLIAWIAMMVMSLISIDIIRRRCWELFKFVHVILAPVVLVFSSIHARGWERTLPVLGVAIGLLLIDYLFRFVFGYILPTRVVKIEYDEKSAITKIVFEKSNFGMWSNERLGMGKFVYINIPKVSLFQSHPISISSYIQNDYSVEFTCHIKNNGKGWSKDIADFALKRNGHSPLTIYARVEGPFGRLSLDLNTYSTIVLIAGGIGVTPINAIFEELTKTSKVNYQKNIHVIWSMKDESMMQMFPSLQRLFSHVKQSFYVTNSKTKFMQINSSTATRNTVHYNSRPNFTKHLNLISESVGSDNSVAIIVCGPYQMNIDVHNSARMVSYEKGVHFHVHKETFEM